MPVAVPYTSQIVRASGLLPDTKLLLAHWDLQQSVQSNLQQMKETNIFGKAARLRISMMLLIFERRYLSDPALLRALVTFVQERFSDEALNRILYFQTLRADRLLFDVVQQVIAPMAYQGQHEIAVQEIESWIEEQVAAGLTNRRWGPATVRRVAAGMMATLRDFGLLEGVVHKRIVPMYMPTTAFSFIALQFSAMYPSGDRLLNAPEWNAFLLRRETVERLFLEAHQERLLQYYAAGRVIRIEFPESSLEAYARYLTARSR